ncbi:MAG: tRNA (adenosine(37)-N6)-threonylcarbamoyltransferase complex transferase subunit TsaD [Desulfuromonas sp.]|jgi:N6-L-threonylcarbamoyladenine synthase|nr:tRNA (adenosine(37)-N6)-threonylcarbamoyltransferase complex transferase subunit TsaD [Desulfuromonas thiophila]
MRILAIESSCDETSAAVVCDGRRILSNIVSSQVDIHALYGGVVPELAARQHLEAGPLVVEQALQQAGVCLSDIEAVAVTQGPGLVGALLVGLSLAKGIAWGAGLPLVGVHHIEGHILAPLLERDLAFPFLALAVSGGHTHLYRVEGFGQYHLLGQTLDDAAGEAFDKVAKMCGLTYPGGALIDRLAAQGDGSRFALPRPMLQHEGFDFSFSGIKTAVLTLLKKQPELAQPPHLADLAASFQEAVVEVLSKKTFAAAHQHRLERIVVAGGVACNSGLRQRCLALAQQQGLEVVFPSPALCGDNAAMLAVAAEARLRRGADGYRSFDARPVWPLEQVTRLSSGTP